MSACVCLAFLDQGGSDDDGAEPLKIKTISIRSAFKRWLLCGGVKQMHLGHKLISYQTLCYRLLPQNKSRNLRLELFVLFPDLQHLGDPVAESNKTHRTQCIAMTSGIDNYDDYDIVDIVAQPYNHPDNRNMC